MSGHSKWATTHRQKEANDAKKGAAFTKLAVAITIAVKQGGGIGDPEKNFKLRLAVDKARQMNMPKDNIARAIEKGTGAGGGDQLEEALFEGFLPGGVAMLAEAHTDNHVRTAQQVRTIVEKAGGTLGGSGSVAYLFTQMGEVIADVAGKNAQEAELAAIDAGAEEVEVVEGKMIVYCSREATFEVKDKLEAAGYKVDAAELVMKPNVPVEVNDAEVRERIEKILGDLEDLDDVSRVWANYA